MGKKSAKTPEFNLVQWLLIGLFTALVFTFNKTIFDPVLLPRQHVLAIFTIALAGVLFIKNKNAKKPGITAWLSWLPYTVLAIITWLSIQYSFNTADAWYTFSKILLIAAFFGSLVYAFASERIKLSQLFWVVVVFNLLILFTLTEDLLNIGLTKGLDVFQKNLKGKFANPNLASSILYLSIVSLLGFYDKSRPKILLIGLLALNFIFLYLIGTRTIIPAIIIAAAAFLFLKMLGPKLKPKLGSLIIWLLLLVGSLSVVYNSAFLKEHTFKDPRFDLWAKSVEMTKEYPAGVGAGNWRHFLPKYGLQEFSLKFQEGVAHYQRPHNEMIGIWTELGWSGLIVYFIFWGAIIWQGILYLHRGNYAVERLFLISGILGFWAISFLDFPLERIEHNALFFLLIAALAHGETAKDKKEIKFQRYFLIVFAIMAGLLSYQVISLRINGEFEMFKIQTNRNQNIQGNLMLTQPQKSFNEYFSVDPTSAPVFYFSALKNYMDKNYQKSLVEFNKAQELHPYHMHVLNGKASCLAQLGQEDSALFYYMKVLEISPNYNRTLINASEINIRKKDFESSKNLLTRIPYSQWDARIEEAIKLTVYGLFEQAVIDKNYNEPANLNQSRLILQERYKDAFYKFSRHGLPLEDYFESLYKNGIVLDVPPK